MVKLFSSRKPMERAFLFWGIRHYYHSSGTLIRLFDRRMKLALMEYKIAEK